MELQKQQLKRIVVACAVFMFTLALDLIGVSMLELLLCWVGMILMTRLFKIVKAFDYLEVGFYLKPNQIEPDF